MKTLEIEKQSSIHRKLWKAIHPANHHFVSSCFLVIACCLFASGCATHPSSYFRNGTSNSIERIRVAIIPFNNLSSQRDADMKITYALITHLLRSNFFDVVEIGETKKAMQDAKVRKDEELTVEQIKSIGNRIDAKVLVLGVVDEFKIDASTLMGEKIFVPEVSIGMRLVSSKDASILWSANHHRRGDDRVTVFGMGRIDSISELTDVIIRDIVGSLATAVKNEQDAITVLHNGGETIESPKIPQTTEADQSVDLDSLRENIKQLRAENEKLKAEITQFAPAEDSAESMRQASESSATLPIQSEVPSQRTASENQAVEQPPIQTSVSSDTQFIKERIVTATPPESSEIAQQKPWASLTTEEQRDHIRETTKQTYAMIKAGY